MYNFIDKEFFVQKVGDVLKLMSAGAVDTSAIRGFVHGGACINPLEFDAVSQGYPAYRKDLELIRDVTLDNIIEQDRKN